MIQIITDIRSPRLTYVLDFVFNQVLKTEYLICDYNQISESTPYIFYSNRVATDTITLIPSKIIEANHTVDQNCLDMIFDATHNWLHNGHLSDNIDIFGIIFCYLSRYEEYMEYESDQWHRFLSRNSRLFHLSPDEPIVEQLIEWLKTKIEAYFPQYVFPNLNHYSFISTIDIDQPWAYKYKGWRILLTLGNAFYQLEFRRVWTIFQVVFGIKADPFDTYQYIKELHDQYGISPIYFILLSQRLTTIDRNHHPTSKQYRTLIQLLSKEAVIGIHPSFNSQQDENIFQREVATLQEINGQSITVSRQHFLIMNLPGTYRRLLNAGILDDYTMGFADRTGYRAGTGHTFFWYDIALETTTDLRVHPFIAMDATMKNYQLLSQEEASEIIREYISTARKNNSPFTLLWHNSSLDEESLWKGWEKVYENSFKAS